MAKYYVNIIETITKTFIVEADSREQARVKGWDIAHDDTYVPAESFTDFEIAEVGIVRSD